MKKVERKSCQAATSKLCTVNYRFVIWGPLMKRLIWNPWQLVFLRLGFLNLGVRTPPWVDLICRQCYQSGPGPGFPGFQTCSVTYSTPASSSSALLVCPGVSFQLEVSRIRPQDVSRKLRVLSRLSWVHSAFLIMISDSNKTFKFPPYFKTLRGSRNRHLGEKRGGRRLPLLL